MFWNRHEVYKDTLSAQRWLIKTDTTERFITALEEEPQGFIAKSILLAEITFFI